MTAAEPDSRRERAERALAMDAAGNAWKLAVRSMARDLLAALDENEQLREALLGLLAVEEKGNLPAGDPARPETFEDWQLMKAEAIGAALAAVSLTEPEKHG